MPTAVCWTFYLVCPDFIVTSCGETYLSTEVIYDVSFVCLFIEKKIIIKVFSESA